MKIAPAAKAPLPIAVITAGKIGSTFAYQLARAGHSVTVIASKAAARLQAVWSNEAQ